MKREIRDAIRSLQAAREDLWHWSTLERLERLGPDVRRQHARAKATLDNVLADDGMLRHCLTILEDMPEVDD